jgi:signal peptidase I
MNLNKYRRMLTPGHGIALVASAVVVYFAWGKVFSPGGTGSNVVLGLLLAIAALYIGMTNLGPKIDDVLAGARKHARRIVRDAEELADEVDEVLRRAKKGKLRPKIDDKQQDAIAAAHGAFRQALAAVTGSTPPTEAEIAHLTTQIAELEKVLQKELGEQKAGFLSQARSLGIAFAIAAALRLFFVAPFQIPSGSMIPTLLIGDHLFVFRAMYGLQSPVGKEPSYLVRWSIPKNGDVVVFEAPPWVERNAGEDWIKRVIAGPGQRVRREGTQLYVDDKPYALLGEGKLTRYMDFEEIGGGRGIWREQVASYHQEQIVGGPLHDVFTDMPPSTGDWPNGAEPRPEQRGLSCTPRECTVKEGFVFVMGDNRDHSADGRRWGAVPVDNIKGKALFIWVSVDGSENSVDLGQFTLPRFRWSRVADWIR